MDDLPADRNRTSGSLIKLDAYAVTNIIDKGATMLKSARAPEFKTREGWQNDSYLPPPQYRRYSRNRR